MRGWYYKNITFWNKIINLQCNLVDNCIPLDDIFNYHPFMFRNVLTFIVIIQIQRKFTSVL